MLFRSIIDVLRSFPKRDWKKESLCQIVQPDGLQDAIGQRQQAKATIAAADGLGLIEEGAGGAVKLKVKTQRSTREIVLEAIDREVLASTQIEPWFAPFYSYLLWQGAKAAKGLSRDAWAAAFNRDVLNDRQAKNQFNGTKYSGLLRWFSYAGLGWTDSLGTFQPNPYGRVARGLPAVFDGTARLTSDEFMSRIGVACPELDGGTIFRQTNTNWTPDARLCSLGLSHALVDLHLDKVLVLVGTVDSRGWSVASAVPPGGDPYGRIDFVEFTGRATQ